MKPDLNFSSAGSVVSQGDGSTILVFGINNRLPLEWRASSKNFTVSHYESLIEGRVIVGESGVMIDASQLVVDSPEGWEFIKKNPSIAPWVRAGKDQL
jgi:hypothetical protein